MRKRDAGLNLLTLGLVVVLFLVPTTAFAQSEESTALPTQRRFLFTEINLGNAEHPHNLPDSVEHVAVTNVGHTAQSVAGLQIEYLKAPTAQTEPEPVCDLFPWPDEQLGTDYSLLEVNQDYSLEPGQTLRLEISLTNSRGGSLRLTEMVDSTLVFHDLVGWNRSSSQSRCYQQNPIEIGTDLSANRIQSYNLDYQDSAHNHRDFATGFGPSIDACANLDGLQLVLPAGMEVNELGECLESTVPSDDCEGLRINELLPNPAGPDTSNEFVELYNYSQQVVDLAGCELQVGDNQPLALADYSIDAQDYLVLTDSELGFTLPNAAGGTVYLLSQTTELDSVTYPAALDDDQSFSWFDDVDQPTWRATYSATAGGENVFTEYLPCPTGQFRNPDTNRCNTVVTTAENGLEDCGPGRYRHPDTNRCRNIDSGNDLVPCGPGQYRNPETNRCRQIATTASSLQPCAPDQFRNPQTNRCKKIESDDGLKPCGPGQERNPETNRCRKVATVAAATTTGPTSTAEDDEQLANDGINVPVITAAVLAAAGYGLYEYRQDLRAWIWRLKQRFSP